MANSYNTNPIVLDTVMAQPSKSLGCAFRGIFQIWSLHWNNSKTSGTDQILLVDNLGNPIYADYATSAGFFALEKPIVVADFQLTRIDSGILFLYL